MIRAGSVFRCAEIEAMRLAGVAQTGARPGRLLLTNTPENLHVSCNSERFARERRASCEKLVEHHAQRVNVGTRVDIDRRRLSLLRAHILERAHDGAELGEQRSFGESLIDRLGDAEVDYLGDGTAIMERDEHVRGLQVAVNDPLLVRVLDRPGRPG